MLNNTDWIQHEIRFNDAVEADLLIALLNSFDINGIEQINDGLIVHYQNATITDDIKKLCESAPGINATHTLSTSSTTNWNAVWESSFKPVAIDDFCIIYAAFHQIDQSKFQHAIEITPQMSFGTGHHETTRLMIRQMRDHNFNQKRVFDFGSGTGILAILSAKIGAAYVLGIDNMEIAVENAIENARNNDANTIIFKHDDTCANVNDTFDFVLVNIIRRVIIDNLDYLVDLVAPGGVLFLSGFLTNDGHKMRYKLNKSGFMLLSESTDNNWLCQVYRKTE